MEPSNFTTEVGAYFGGGIEREATSSVFGDGNDDYESKGQAEEPAQDLQIRSEGQGREDSGNG